MYSLVMLMALGTAGEAPDYYYGCGYGGYCGSYCGGYYGGYCGYYGGYCGSYCYSPCYSYACYPVYTCAPVYCHPMMVVPSTPKKEEKKKPEEVSTRATIVVHLPADAKLTFDGEATKSTSEVRTFVTPELKPGTNYSYMVKAEVMKDGKPVVIAEKKVSIQAGVTTEVTLGTSTVAAR